MSARVAPDTSFAAYVKNAQAEEAAWEAEEGKRRARAAKEVGKDSVVVEAARNGVVAEDDGHEVLVRIGGRGYELLRRAAVACSSARNGPRLDAGDVALLYGVVQASGLADAYTFGRQVRDIASAGLGGPSGVLSFQARERLNDLELELVAVGLMDPAELKEVGGEAL